MSLLDVGNRAMRQLLKARGIRSDVEHLEGCDLHFYRQEGTGRGPPILLLHGLGSSANAFFRTIVPLSRTFGSVWALDLPGNGFSPPPRRGHLPMQAYVDVILAFRRRIIGERIILLGNSMGGGLSLHAASQDPDALRGLMLVSPAGAPVSDELFGATLKNFDVADAREARRLARKLYHEVPWTLLLFADQLRQMVSTETVKHLVSELKPSDSVTPEMLSRLKMPTLLLWGQSEKLLPYEGLEYFRRFLPRESEIHEVAGFGHVPHMEHPEEFVRHVSAFAQKWRLV
jgi:pimeloyl-ACP methyl ester carboxylesterase